MPQGLKSRKLQYIDIQDGEIVRGKSYRGGNGKKYTWNYQNTRYMIKSQEKNQKTFLTIDVNKQSSLTYNNSILSEYVSSNIVNYLQYNNITAHNTFIIKDDRGYDTYFFVACEHLENKDINELHLDNEFIVLSDVDGFRVHNLEEFDEITSRKKDKTRFDDMIDWIYSQDFYSNQDELCDHFYDMFVFDTFLLNWDRNHTNWGFILQWDNNILKKIKIAPLIDFGSSLFAKQDETEFNKITQDDFKSQVDYLILNSKSFYLDENDEKIIYHDFLKTTNDTMLLKKYNAFLKNERLKDVNDVIDSLNLPINLIRGYQYLISRSQELMKESLLQNKHYQKLIDDDKNKSFKKQKQNSFSR